MLELSTPNVARPGLNPMHENVHDLSLQQTVLNQFMAEIRDKEVQKDSLRFRRSLERVGEILA